MFRIVDGNLLNAEEINIVHQVNCQGVMGSGVAKQIKGKYPKAFEEYKKMYKEYKQLDKPLLGEVQQVKINESRTVINLFAQENYGVGVRQTNYIAFMQGMLNLIKEVKSDIALPYKIGCYRGGADWDIIEHFLKGLAEDFKYNITVYKYDGE